MIDRECICRGNWRDIIKEYGPLIGKKFVYEGDGEYYTFFGVVHGDDDYYYGMMGHMSERPMLLSCVGSLKTFGFKLVEEV